MTESAKDISTEDRFDELKAKFFHTQAIRELDSKATLGDVKNTINDIRDELEAVDDCHSSIYSPRLAKPYSAHKAYAVGEWVLRDFSYWLCLREIPIGGEPWTPSHWEQHIELLKYLDGKGGGGTDADAVHYYEELKSDEEKELARANIGAAAIEDIPPELEFDEQPQENSRKAVRSGGIWSWVKSLLPSWLTPTREEPPTQEDLNDVSTMADQALTMATSLDPRVDKVEADISEVGDALAGKADQSEVDQMQETLGQAYSMASGASNWVATVGQYRVEHIDDNGLADVTFVSDLMSNQVAISEVNNLIDAKIAPANADLETALNGDSN